MNVNWIQGIWVIGLVATVNGQLSLEAPYRSTGKAMMQAFEPQRAVLQTSSAVIMDGREEAGYGVVISKEGHILTKASEFELLKAPEVMIDRKKFKAVEVLGSDPTWDVTLIKVDATDLIPVVYAETSAVPAGTWIVGNGVTSRLNRRALMGVVSANIREIPVEGGLAIGVQLNTKGDLLQVEEVNEKGGAYEAGIEKGDVLLTMDGQEVKKMKDMLKVLKGKSAGDKVELTYKRGEKEHKTEIELKAKSDLFGAQKMSRNDMMSGLFSKRRSGFPRVLQHTILGARTTVGGPLLNLDGQCLGMNIARANRAESFAIPLEDVKEIAERLMSKAKK